jgi:ATP-dependent Clp protease ATP-binding subunit ClpC
MFEHFTEGARAALMQAHAEAQARSDGHVGVEHLLVGMLPDGTGVAASILAEASVTPDAARAALDDLFGPPPTVPPADALAAIGIDLDRVNTRLTETFGDEALAPKPIPYDEDAQQALMAAVAAAEGRQIGTQHVLAGVLGRTDGRAVKLLEHLGVDPAALAGRI